MIITEATWEKRNFGMDTYEILLDNKDLEKIDKILEEIASQSFQNAYVVIKLPIGNIKAVHALEDDGFRFLETQFFFTEYFDAKNSTKNKFKYNITKKIIPKNKKEWERIIQKITPGMFNSDRVSLDPALGIEIACKRYQNWCRDLFNNPNSYLSVGEFDGQEYCFGIYIKKEKILNVVLVGIFEEYKNLGLGSTLLDKDLFFETKTSTSSNNLGALKVYQSEGLIICEQKYVLRKIYE